MHLEEQGAVEAIQEKEAKRKREEEERAGLKKRVKLLQSIAEDLEKKADSLSLDAEAAKDPQQMARKLVEANGLCAKRKKKLCELEEVVKELDDSANKQN